ncbi:hypothetical protein C8Q79DRAFT_764906 [Trametes meyenii]|nr:hypothetical protein C8Q79DRAFT_764906 [Trametes meyenii]
MVSALAIHRRPASLCTAHAAHVRHSTRHPSRNRKLALSILRFGNTAPCYICPSRARRQIGHHWEHASHIPLPARSSGRLAFVYPSRQPSLRSPFRPPSRNDCLAQPPPPTHAALPLCLSLVNSYDSEPPPLTRHSQTSRPTLAQIPRPPRSSLLHAH